MLITSKNLCHYLLSKRFISAESVVDGDFVVVDMSGRNRNFKVIRQHSPGLFVKQIQNWNPQAIAMLQCEAACYWFAQKDGAQSATAQVMPQLYWYDVERHLLVTELVAESYDFFEYRRRTGVLPETAVSAVGKVLGDYHRQTQARFPTADLTIFPKQIPWILLSDRRNSHPFKALTTGTSSLFDRVEATPELRSGLDAVQNRWRADSIIHGDMRWENCMFIPHESEARVKLVDWELADVGDASWDIGSLMQSFICNISGAPTASHPEPYPAWDSLVRSLQVLWRSYSAALGLTPASHGEELNRAINFAAARLVQTAYEYVQFSAKLSPEALRLLDLSCQIWRAPETFAQSILGA